MFCLGCLLVLDFLSSFDFLVFLIFLVLLVFLVFDFISFSFVKTFFRISHDAFEDQTLRFKE